VRNEKARRFLASMRKKPGVDLAAYFPRADAGALALLRRLLAFDPADRPTAEEALADPYFHNLHSPAREPSAQAISKLAFDFERHKLAIEEVRELIYREILEYHPQVLQDYLSGGRLPTFLYPSAVDNFKRQFHHLEGGGEGRCTGGRTPLARHHAAIVHPYPCSMYAIAIQQDSVQ
jgi:serine/threonine protein kinase